MRKLMFYTIGFVGATALAAYLLRGRGLLVLGFVSLVCALFLFAFSGNKARIGRLILLGCATSFVWVWLTDTYYLSDIRLADGEEITLSVEVDQYSVPTDYGITTDGTVTLNGKPYRIRIYSYEPMELEPGDLLEGLFRIQYTGSSTQEDIYYSGSGIYLIGYLREGTRIPATKVSLRHYPAIWRQRILTLMQNMLPSDVLGFAQALLLGEKSGLDYKTNTDLAVSGIRHVVAVSGLHVSILCSIVFSVLGERRILTPSIGILLLITFAALTGFTPSVMRACVMHTLVFLSLGFLREYDAPTALAFAVLVMLCINPMAVTSVSLQLSVACVVGIFLFSKRIRDFILSEKCLGKASPRSTVGKLQRWIADSVSVTVSTLITTMPLCAVYFGMVSVLGIVTNLITLWLISCVFCGLLSSIIAGFIWLPLGQLLCWLIAWPIRFVLVFARLIASVPFAAVYTQSPYVVAWIVFFYVLLSVFALTKRKNPWQLVLCTAGGLCAAVLLSCAEPKLDNFRMTVLDVGQGQCIILQNDDQHYLVDCGGDSDIAVADLTAGILLSQGITRLDGVILTHYDKDHMGALLNLLTRVPADTLYSPVDENGELILNTYFNRIIYIDQDNILQLPDVDVTVFSGSGDSSDNESSLCVLFQPENCDILITGDRSVAGERDLLEQTVLPQVDVLVVGHHGAKDSTGLELLMAIKPETAIISVGEDNRYDHPSDEVLERLALFGCNILRTDVDGTIMIRG